MRVICILLLLSVCTTYQAQEYYNDAQVRANLGLEKRITKKFSVTLDQQYRFTKNVGEFTRASYDLGIVYKINKNIRLKADYVFIEKKNKRGYFTERNWYYLALVLKHEVGAWSFIYRNLAQGRMGPRNSDDANITRFYDRNKITVRHQTTRRAAFWIAEEIYIPLNSPGTKGIERSRTYLGTTIKTFKRQSLDLYFMFQARLQRNYWFDQEYQYPNTPLNHDYIYGINYTIEF